MNWTLELVILPVSDVDRAKDFYSKIGFHADHDQVVSEDIRFVQMTPPGSACSIAFGKGLTDAAPGSVKGLQVVVPDIDEARDHLLSVGVDPGEIDRQAWGHFVHFDDPDGNHWAVQYMPYRQN
ncbi:VOC family protein [Gordonia sp. zg691]|uniref:VOC family protein n=1 Tax=Gordonia jinghuaiqii TaxID=2758710 RepID=A0A7D7LZF4_9ACTN|nr:VOC family protein [Gordonia jinghuaiqii]MBD0863991.1 VOC family protein [Gordonia jinghuaiqii]MCR5977897.1 glyoxalase [Gordonia jinghuaiqii]QMT02554.1 VOC family protein [Gordonia jinghuaiqii]